MFVCFKVQISTQETKSKMECINPHMSIIMSNVNGSNISFKSQRLSDWVKNNIQLYAIYRTHTLNPNTYKQVEILKREKISYKQQA